jgi:acyl-homoserine-lactone acylase
MSSCFVLAGSCATNTAPSAIAPPAGTEILWDTYGVPHIYAKDRSGLAYAFGWAQMRNHSDLLLRLILQSRGRASEFLGKDYLDEDRWVWTIGIPETSARDYALQRPEMRAHIEAFAAGINAFAAANPTMIGDSVRAALPVTGVDVIENLQRLSFGRFITSRQGVKDQTRTWEKGSNAWAIAPSHSASGHAMLLENPHLPWSDIFTWIEAEYSMPGIDVYGAAVIGSPVLQIAFNDNLGWSHTVNTQDGEDLYELTLSGDGYLFDGKVRPFEGERVHVIKVRGANGAFSDDTVRYRRSVQGPIVASRPGKAIALRVVGMGQPLIPFPYQQWWEMGAARNFAEFQKAITPNQISGQNITYADRDGHIMEFYGGNTPVRPRGDRAYWAGIIRGDSSSTLWTKLHTYADMPKTIDPPSGWVQNANDPPWWATFPVVVHPQDYPSYLATKAMAARPQRSIRMLRSDSSISYEELLQYKHSTRMELADRVLDDLLALARGRGVPEGIVASDVLSNWDRSADAGSRGAVLFNEWWSEYGRRMGAKSRWTVPWSEQRPLDTPYGIADTTVALAALDAAEKTIKTKYGALDVPWGDVYRLMRDSLDLPANGGPAVLGIFRVTDYSREGATRYRASFGDSYVGVVEFSNPIRAMSLIGYGNASRTGSPHRVDQLPLYSRKELKPVWRTRADVEAHTERREKF